MDLKAWKYWSCRKWPSEWQKKKKTFSVDCYCKLLTWQRSNLKLELVIVNSIRMNPQVVFLFLFLFAPDTRFCLTVTHVFSSRLFLFLLIFMCPIVLSAALLDTVRLCLSVRILPLQPVRGVQRATRRLCGPGPPPLATTEPGSVTPRRRDEHACRGDPFTHDL